MHHHRGHAATINLDVGTEHGAGRLAGPRHGSTDAAHNPPKSGAEWHLRALAIDPTGRPAGGRGFLSCGDLRP